MAVSAIEHHLVSTLAVEMRDWDILKEKNICFELNEAEQDINLDQFYIFTSNWHR